MDKNKATEITVELGGTLDFVINYLIDAREKEQNIFIDFYGHKLYSSDVTVDSAYKEVCGCTREEFRNKIEQRKERKANKARNFVKEQEIEL